MDKKVRKILHNVLKNENFKYLEDKIKEMKQCDKIKDVYKFKKRYTYFTFL